MKSEKPKKKSRLTLGWFLAERSKAKRARDAGDEEVEVPDAPLAMLAELPLNRADRRAHQYGKRRHSTGRPKSFSPDYNSRQRQAQADG